MSTRFFGSILAILTIFLTCEQKGRQMETRELIVRLPATIVGGSVATYLIFINILKGGSSLRADPPMTAKIESANDDDRNVSTL
jgi:hypothetical protein